jgi:hypothetical protein
VSLKPCKYPSHRNTKVSARKLYEHTPSANPPSTDFTVLPGILEKIQSAIDENRSVYISFSHRSHGSHPHKITLIKANTNRCGNEGRKVLAHCHINNIEKEFYFHNIKKIKDYDWENANPPASQPPGIFHYIFFVISITNILFRRCDCEYAHPSLAYFCERIFATIETRMLL